jgi:RNA polymerase sigma-70 factor (ECF subfamily)
MVKKFPRVGRFVDADDVTQSSLIRLLAAFRQIRPASRRHFYALANELIRRELLDLAKHYYGPHGAGTRLADAAADESAPADEPDAADLDRMTAFHEAVARLPPEEREAIGLSYYHGWGQAEIAELYQVSVRTVRRWQASAVERLRDAGLSEP